MHSVFMLWHALRHIVNSIKIPEKSFYYVGLMHGALASVLLCLKLYRHIKICYKHIWIYFRKILDPFRFPYYALREH